MITEQASRNMLLALLTCMVNLGSRWIHEDFDEDLEIFLSNKYMRKLYVFAIVFIATENFNLSLLILILYWIAVYFLSKNDT